VEKVARKKHFDYFGELNHLAANASESAQILQAIMQDYSLEKLVDKAEKIHALEKESDEIVQKIVNELYISFITPIDREDIVQITDHLDDILDSINSLTYLMDHLVVESVTEPALELTDYIVKAAAGVQTATKEFAKFKNSKTLVSMIDEVNQIESQGDRLYSNSIKELITTEKDVLKVIKWKDVYDQLEATINACEVAVNIIVGIVIKNS
jgi:predicted phosphate transport protein (TIGR00153 family)